MSGSSPIFGSLLDNVFPRVPPFFSLINEQSAFLAETFNSFVIYTEKGDPAVAQAIVDLEVKAGQFKDKMLDTLADAFSTPMDREDVYRAIMSIHQPIAAARIAGEEMFSLQIKPDRFIMEMAVALREGAASIQRGYGKLEKSPSQADSDATAAIQCRLGIDKTYRRALASLYSVDEVVQALRTHDGEAEVNAMNKVIDILKRREIYKHLHDAGDRLAETGTVLHSIIIGLT